VGNRPCHSFQGGDPGVPAQVAVLDKETSDRSLNVLA
jgi:hypothetical protein